MRPKILIVGGGWSGLSAATWLCMANQAPTILESAPQLGGRARTVAFQRPNGPKIDVDNGQHLFLGAYTALFELLKLLNIKPSDVFIKKSFYWKINSLNLLKLLSIKELLSLVKFIYKIKKTKNTSAINSSLLSFLTQYQSINLQELVWKPLCLAAFSTRAEHTCAMRFINLIQSILSTKKSAFYFAKKNLSELFVKPTADFVLAKGGTIQCLESVDNLIIENNKILGVNTKNNSFLADHIILATPPWVSQKLIAPTASLNMLDQELLSYQSTMISTLYLQYAPEVKLKQELNGLTGTLAQWVFDRGFMGQAGLFAVIITGDPKENKTNLIRKIEAELHTNLNLPHKALHTKLIQEKKAAFSCFPNLPTIMPKTSVDGLWLCGDYLNPIYPATLESAVASGKYTAELILETIQAQTKAQIIEEN